MKKHWLKRLKRMTALGLSALLAAATPLQSAAEISQTIGNTRSENEDILKTLEKISDGEKGADEVYAQLEAMGLIGADGRITTKSILVDGEEKTVDDVLTMIEEETDLEKKVSVDGTELRLKDLKLMAEIEAELARIERDYFNPDVVLTDEQRTALDSLQKQVQETGISLVGEENLLNNKGVTQVSDQGMRMAAQPLAEGEEKELIFASGYDYGARLYVKAEAPAYTEDGKTTVPNKDVTFDIVVYPSKKLDYDVSFYVKTIDGSAVAGVNYEKIEDHKVVLKKGETEVRIPIIIKKEDTDWVIGNKIWDGTIAFFLQFNLAEGILFSDINNKNAVVRNVSKSHTIFIENKMSFDIKNFPFKASVEQNKGDKPVKIDLKSAWQEEKKMNYLLKNGNLYLRKEMYPTGLQMGVDGESWNDRSFQINSKIFDFDEYYIRNAIGRTVYSSALFTDPLTKKEKELFDSNYGGYSPDKLEKEGQYLPDGSGYNFDWFYDMAGEDRIPLHKELTSPAWDEKSLSDFSEAERKSLIDGGVNLSTYTGSYFWFYSAKPAGNYKFPCGLTEYKKGKTDFYITTAGGQSLFPTFKVPDGDYRVGDSIPMTINLNQPIHITDSEALFRRSRRIVADYTVEKVGSTLYSPTVQLRYDNTSFDTKEYILTADCDGFYFQNAWGENIRRAMFETEHTATGNITLEDHTVDALFREGTISLEADSWPETSSSESTLVTGYIPSKYQDILQENATPDENGNFYLANIAVSADGKQFSKIYFSDSYGNYVKDNPKYISSKVAIDPVASLQGKPLVIETWKMDGDTPVTVYMKNYIPYKQYTPTLLDASRMDIIEPEGYPKDVIFANEEIAPENLKLKARVGSWGCTWDDVEWKPADAESARVASIDQTGQITLNGSSGTARFILEAKNGGHTPLEGEDESLYQVISEPITVKAGYTPYLSVPEASNTVIARVGNPVKVRWTTNLFDKHGELEAGKKTALTLKLYEARYGADGTLLAPSEDALLKTVPIEGTQEEPVYEYAFEGLDRVAEFGKLSYLYTVEGEVDSGIPGAPTGEDGISKWPTLSATGYIELLASPAEVSLTRPSSLYLSNETESLPLSWNTQYLDNTNGYEFHATVTNNQTGNIVASLSWDSKTDGASGSVMPDSLWVPLDVQGGFKNIFTIEAKVRNLGDNGYSFDSYNLEVYDTDSLKLQVDGEIQEDNAVIELNNQEMYKNMTEKERLNIWRNIQLIKDVSINSKEFAWETLTDRMRWTLTSEAENGGTAASLNRNMAGGWTDIDDLGLSNHDPNTEFLLVGKEKGSGTLEVAHDRASGLEAKVSFNIDTLKDKLYLLQFYPAAETTFTYVDGTGTEKTVTTGDDGRSSLYEEHGIVGDIHAQSEKNDELYLGTFAARQFETQERDAAQSEWYPVNTLRLRKAAKVPVSIKKPDGTPYTGTIHVKGGLLVDGQYEENVLIDGKDGVKGFNIKLDGMGFHEFSFDITQASKPITASSQMEFLFEFQVSGSEYYPLILTTAGAGSMDTVIRTEKRVLTLEKRDETLGETPFVGSREVYFNKQLYGTSNSVLDKKVKIGPSDSNPQLAMETVAFWWGSDASKTEAVQSLEYRDSFGNAWKAQESELLDYPFFDMPVVQNVLYLNEDSVKEMRLSTYESVGLELVYKSQKSDTDKYEIQKTENTGLRVINMMGAGNLTDDERLTIMLQDIRFAAGSVNEAKQSIGNSMIGMGINMATRVQGGLPFLTLKLMPTEDPTYYKGLIMIGINNLTNDNVVGFDPQDKEYGDLDYLPGFSDLASLYKNGIVGYGKEGKSLVKYASALIQEQGKRGLTGGLASNGVMRDGNPYYAMKGYFETGVYFDYDKKQWEMELLGGGMTAGGGYAHDWKWNASVGPVPVLAELGFGAGVAIDFQAASDRQIKRDTYLTELRLMVYLRAFGGLGFDYAVVALKVGLYGQVNLDARFNFLNKNVKVGQSVPPEGGYYFSADGSVGIRFGIKLLFISYDKILIGTSFDFGSLHDKTYFHNQGYFETVKGGKSGNDYEYFDPSESFGISELSEGLEQSDEDEMLALSKEASKAISKANLVFSSEEMDLNLYEVPIEATLEQREYLEEYDRKWNVPMTTGQKLVNRAKRLLSSSGIDEMPKEVLLMKGSDGVNRLLTNAYPYADPVVNDDGSELLFLTDQEEADVTKTRVAYLKRDKNGAPLGEEILSDEGYGDNQLKLDGRDGYGAATWSRVMIDIKKEPGSVLDPAEQAQMMNSSDIMAAILKDGKWSTYALTEKDSMSDMAPAVATNGKRTIVAWRRVASSDSEALTTFDVWDEIVCRVYDAEKEEWSDLQVVYNGTNGSVAALEASMLADGTAAITYSVNTKTKTRNNPSALSAEIDENGMISSGQEIFCTVLSKDVYETITAEQIKTIRLTSDEVLDENPQIIAVQMDGNRYQKARTTAETGANHFVLGWHSLQTSGDSSQSDIRLAAIDREGNRLDGFPESLRTVTDGSGSNVNANFHFAKGAETLNDLALVWKEPVIEVVETKEELESGQKDSTDEGELQLTQTDYDLLRAAKFVETEDGILMTAAQELSRMGEQTVIEHFDAYVSGNTVKAVILGSWYDTENLEEIPVDFGGEQREDIQSVQVAKAMSSIYEAEGQFTDKMIIDYILPDYNQIYTDSVVSVQIGMTNLGTTMAERVEVKLGEQTYTFASGENGENGVQEFAPLKPGESRTLTVEYPIGATIMNPEYSLRTTFANGAVVETEDFDGNQLRLDVPDIGISSFKILEEQDGERLLQVTVYNGRDSKVEKENRIVKVGLFRDAECTMPLEDEYLTESSPVKTTQVTTKDVLEKRMVDDRIYTVQYGFDVAKYIKQCDTVQGKDIYPFASPDGEIRDTGIQIYAKAWLEEENADTNEWEEIGEFDIQDNYATVRVESLLQKMEGEPVSITAVLVNEETEEEAGILAKVLSSVFPKNQTKENTEATEGSGNTGKSVSGSKAVVKLQNNSIIKETSGNVIVTLLDDVGRVIEAKQLYDPSLGEEGNFGLLTVEGEGIWKQTFQFTQRGSAVKAYYSNHILDSGMGIKDIRLEGTELRLAEFKDVEDVQGIPVMKLATLEVTNKEDGVLVIEGLGEDGVLRVSGAVDVMTEPNENEEVQTEEEAQTNGNDVPLMGDRYLGNVPLSPGKVNQVIIETGTGEHAQTYILNIINRKNEEEGGNENE